MDAVTRYPLLLLGRFDENTGNKRLKNNKYPADTFQNKSPGARQQKAFMS